MIELYNLVLNEIEDRQRTWYNSGIGTYARPSWKSLKYYKQVLYHNIDVAIAWSVQLLVSKLCFHSSLGHSGILKKQFWVHTAGYRIIMRTMIVSFFSVRRKMISKCFQNIFTSNHISGFSRGAFQVRVLSAMIHKVRSVLFCLECKLTTPEICRWPYL